MEENIYQELKELVAIAKSCDRHMLMSGMGEFLQEEIIKLEKQIREQGCVIEYESENHHR